jgi:hypothetical protein
MYISTVEVENYRAFRQAALRLPQYGLVMVAGANNTGKSSLLSGLDVLAGSPGDTAALRHVGTGGPIRVTGTFSLADDERAAVLAAAPDRDRLLASGAVTRLQFVCEERQGQGPGLVEVRGEWPDATMPPLILTRWDAASGMNQIDAVSALGRAGADVAADSPLQLHNRGGYGGQGQQWLDGFVNQPDMAPIGRLFADWRRSFYHFQALRPGTLRAQALGSADRLEPPGTNLAAVLLYLATDRSRLFEQLRGLIAEIVPDIGRLEVRTSGGQLRVVAESASGDLNLKDLGTGVEQLLMTLTVGLLEAPPLTLIIEEPETNLHPAAQRALLGLLQTWAADRQIIIATHSPVMLDWSPGGDRLWLVTRGNEASCIDPVSEDPLPVLKSLGVRLSDVLSADRILVVEGPSDEEVLAEWFPALLRNPRVAVIHGDGGDSAVHADRLASWLADTDRAGMRSVLYLRDRDELSAPVLDKLTASPTVYVLKRRELENYLLESSALAAVLAPFVPAAASPVNAGSIDSYMAETAERLRGKIIANRVARQVAPGRPMMDHRLRQHLGDIAANAEQIIDAVLERLATPQEIRDRIARSWAEAHEDASSHQGKDLLRIAPGQEILDEVFMHFAGRHYDKRRHGAALAKAIPPPDEIREILEAFLSD